MLFIVSEVKVQMVSQSRSTTFSKVANTSLRKPVIRRSFPTCSKRFISAVHGAIYNISAFSVIWSLLDLCPSAPSQHSRIRSSGYCLDSSSRNMFIQVELQYGITRKQELPVTGSTAPYAYRYSRMWWQGTDGRMPFSHQQYLGLLIRPNPASSWNISRTSWCGWPDLFT